MGGFHFRRPGMHVHPDSHDDHLHGPHACGDVDQSDHSRGPRREHRLLLAFVLTTITLGVEAVGGWWSGSLALLADAAHMLVDAGALMFAWLAVYYAQRPADARRSFGYVRLEVLVGYSNALAQFLLVAWIVAEAAMRWLSPQPILSGMMLGVAIAGLVVNVVVLRVLGGHDHDDLNTAAARLHVIGDLLGSIGAVAAALAVRFGGWLWADAAISILVSVLILNSAWRLLRRSAHILLEGTPEGVETALVAATLEREVAGISNVHHVHIWQLAGGSRIATLHVQADFHIRRDQAIVSIQQLLDSRFGIKHVTIQIEELDCAQVDCAGSKSRDAAGSPHGR